MSGELRPCPFCGKQHKESKVHPIAGYTANGEEIPGETFTGIDVFAICGGTFIPSDIWNRRPIEDALRAENEQLKAQLDTKTAEVDRWYAATFEAKQEAAELRVHPLTDLPATGQRVIALYRIDESAVTHAQDTVMQAEWDKVYIRDEADAIDKDKQVVGWMAMPETEEE